MIEWLYKVAGRRQAMAEYRASQTPTTPTTPQKKLTAASLASAAGYAAGPAIAGAGMGAAGIFENLT